MMKKLANEELNRVSVEEFKDLDKFPYVIILDNIRSLNNVGSAFRTADAFKAEKIYLCGITGTPPNREITKTALGATESVVWEYVKDTVELIARLKTEGYTIVSIEQVDPSILLNNFMPDTNSKYAFIFGNEVYGVDERVIQNSDFCLEIPQFGTKHSLNVAVTIGVISWDFVQKKLIDGQC